jgi:hypothetical protein
MSENKRGRKALTDQDRAVLADLGIAIAGGPGRTASPDTLKTRELVNSNAPKVKGGTTVFLPKGKTVATKGTVVKVPGNATALRDALKAFVASNKGFHTISASGAIVLVRK